MRLTKDTEERSTEAGRNAHPGITLASHHGVRYEVWKTKYIL